MAGSSHTAPDQGRRSSFGALRNRNFALLWVGLIISNSGSWMQIVAQGWLVYALTESPFMLGMVGLARALPMIFLPPIGGAVADRVSRLKLLKVTQITMFFLAIPLVPLVALELVEVWHILLFGLSAGILTAFDQPSRQALVPDLVQKQDLAAAIGLNSAAWQGSSLIGPTIAGVTIAAFGLTSAFLLNAVSFIPVIVALFLMRDVPDHSGEPRQRRSLFGDVAVGLKYASTTRVVLTLVLLSAVANVFGRSYQHLLPAFASETLNQDATGLGLMVAAPGAGTIAAAFILAAVGDVNGKGRTMLVSMMIFAVAVAGFAMTRSFAAALPLLVVTGAMAFLFSTLILTMLQLYAPNEMRGRIMALHTVTAQGFAPLGAMIVGATAEFIGIANAMTASAVIVGAAALIIAVSVPAVRRFGASGPPPDDGDEAAEDTGASAGEPERPARVGSS